MLLETRNQHSLQIVTDVAATLAQQDPLGLPSGPPTLLHTNEDAICKSSQALMER